MRIKVLVISEETRSGNKNGKPWEMTTATVVDKSEGARCKTPIEVTLQEGDMDLKGSLEDKVIMLDVTEISAGFKGAIQARALVVREPAKGAKPPTPAPHS